MGVVPNIQEGIVQDTASQRHTYTSKANRSPLQWQLTPNTCIVLRAAVRACVCVRPCDAGLSRAGYRIGKKRIKITSNLTSRENGCFHLNILFYPRALSTRFNKKQHRGAKLHWLRAKPFTERYKYRAWSKVHIRPTTNSDATTTNCRGSSPRMDRSRADHDHIVIYHDLHNHRSTSVEHSRICVDVRREESGRPATIQYIPRANNIELHTCLIAVPIRTTTHV